MTTGIMAPPELTTADDVLRLKPEEIKIVEDSVK
jgi:hypothetical protein